MRSQDEIAQAIRAEIEKFTIIDAHEHLPAEKDRLKTAPDAITMYSHYCKGDLAAAGMKPDKMNFVFSDAPLGQRWREFKPYYDMISNTAYVRAAHIALEHFYGETCVTDENVEPLSQKIKDANVPGLYAKALRDACQIETCLNQNGGYSDDALLTPVIWGMDTQNYGGVSAHSGILGREIASLGDLLEAGRLHVRNIKQNGGVGYKFFVFPMSRPSIGAAKDAFDMIFADRALELPPDNPLTNAYFDAVLGEIQKQELVACVHTGYWGDFRMLNPTHGIYMFDNYPDVAFDMYHAGYPYVREAILLGKTRGNVWMNMCWTYILNTRFAYDALSEMLEAVPWSKIIGFGGDYSVVEKVYGHLVIARKVIAKALAGHVADGSFSYDMAVSIAKNMLYDTPKKLYRL